MFLFIQIVCNGNLTDCDVWIHHSICVLSLSLPACFIQHLIILERIVHNSDCDNYEHFWWTNTISFCPQNCFISWYWLYVVKHFWSQTPYNYAAAFQITSLIYPLSSWLYCIMLSPVSLIAIKVAPGLLLLPYSSWIRWWDEIEYLAWEDTLGELHYRILYGGGGGGGGVMHSWI